MKKSRILAGALALLALASCSKGVKITGTVEGVNNSDLIVKVLDVNTYTAVDTVKTSADGSFSAKVEVEEGQPEFVYIFKGEKKIASLLLSKGDNVKVTADTLGNYTVEGSEESLKLQEVETTYAKFLADLYGSETDRQLYDTYVAYYRDRLAYVMKNPFSLTVVPILYQDIEGMPVFSRTTDAIFYRNATDSLAKAFPASKYVKALEQETKSRENQLELSIRLQNAKELGFPDIKLPNQKGKAVALSEVDAKAIILYFWSSAVPEQNIFNTEKLMPLYNDYHSKGLEIYSVSVDIDKASWASVVKGQKLPWINVNDGLGTASPAMATYNVTQLPSMYLIVDGELYTNPISGEMALRAELTKALR